jgi:acetylornithine deacetylase
VEAIQKLRARWRERQDFTHPYLSPPDVVPTIAIAGEWAVTYPASFRLTCGALYLPVQGDEGGWGSRVEEEVTEWILAATAEDDWLAENPPSVRWSTGVMAMEVPEDSLIVSVLSGARDAVGRKGSLAGLDSWYDGATYTVYGDTPSVGFGTGGFETAHAIDEYVPVDDLVACAQAVAIAAMRFCEESR